MSKQIYTVTAETVISMIEEIHEEVTAVTMQSIGDVHTMILDSVAEDAEIECDIVAVITQWVADNAEPVAQQGTGFETMSNAPRTVETMQRVAVLIQKLHERMMSLEPRYTDDYFGKMIILATRAKRLDEYGIALGEELGVFE